MRYAFTILLVSVSTVAACDRVPLTAPTNSTLTLSADRNVLPLNGQTTLHAIVIESGGTPVHNGTVVTFAPTLGNVTPVEAETINGVATAIFSAGSISGKSSINAFSGGAKTSAATDITIGAAAAKTIAVSASPSSVSQSGGTVTISALVMDESGNSLPGVNVTFSADVGQLAPAVALSDDNGVAKTQLATTQTSTVTVTAGAATNKIIVTVSTAPTVTIDATPNPAVAGTPVAITIAAPTGTGTRQLQSVVVDFGDGQAQTIANPTGTVGLTHTYRSAGGFIITARSTDVAGNTGLATKAVTITQAVPSLTLSAAPNSGTAPFTTAITVTAAGATGGPALSSVRVLVNGDQVYSGTSGGSFAYRIGTAGTYNISAIATDTAGNESRANTVVIAQ